MLDRFKVPSADQVCVSEAVLRQTVSAIFERIGAREKLALGEASPSGRGGKNLPD